MTKTETEFDRVAGSYVQDVNQAVPCWAGAMDKYTRIKADHLRRKLAEYFGVHPPLTLLDAGCGIGLTDEYLKPFFPYLHGFDVSRESVRLAAIRNPEVRYLEASGGEFPYPDAKFDAVFAICVLHHVPPQKRPVFFKEVLRVLRPGGGFWIYEHNPRNPFTRYVVRQCPFDQDAVLIPPKDCGSLLKKEGFEPAEVEYMIFFPSESDWWQTQERRWLRHIPWGAQYCLSAKKP